MQVHRFRDFVAVSTGNGGPTVYLTRVEAMALSLAIHVAADDTARPFAQSACGTWSLDLPQQAFTSNRGA